MRKIRGREDPYFVTAQTSVTRKEKQSATIVDKNYLGQGITIMLVRDHAGDFQFTRDYDTRTVYIFWDDELYSLSDYNAYKRKLLERIQRNPVGFFTRPGKEADIPMDSLTEFGAFVQNQWILGNTDLVRKAFEKVFELNPREKRAQVMRKILMVWLFEKTFGYKLPKAEDGYFEWVAPYNRKLANFVTEKLWDIRGFKNALKDATKDAMEIALPNYRDAKIRDGNPLYNYYSALKKEGRKGVDDPEIYTAKNKSFSINEDK